MVVAPLPIAEDEGESTTIYVKNLAFATTDAGLQVRSRGHQNLHKPPCMQCPQAYEEVTRSLEVPHVGFQQSFSRASCLVGDALLRFLLSLRISFQTARSFQTPADSPVPLPKLLCQFA